MAAKTPRLIKIIGSIGPDSYREFSDQMDVLEQESKADIKIELFSDGGDAEAGLAFYSRIRASTCYVIVMGIGLVASAATIILVAGEGRLMYPEAWFMTHEDGLTKFTGKVTDIEAMANAMRRQEKQWNKILEERTGVHADVWANWNRTDRYFTAQECLELGIIDEIVGGE